MVPLLLITAVLLLTAGLVEAKAASRVGMGLPVLALADLVAGVGLFGVVFVVDFTGAQGLAILIGAVALIVVSSVQVGMEVRRRQRIRTASEGARLATYLNYLSRAGSAGDPGPGRAPGPKQPERPR